MGERQGRQQRGRLPAGPLLALSPCREPSFELRHREHCRKEGPSWCELPVAGQVQMKPGFLNAKKAPGTGRTQAAAAEASKKKQQAGASASDHVHKDGEPCLCEAIVRPGPELTCSLLTSGIVATSSPCSCTGY